MRRINMVIAAGLTIALSTAVGCSTTVNDETTDSTTSQATAEGSVTYGTDDGVAAVVNGITVTEEDVDTQISNYRSQNGISDDDTWTSYLTQIGATEDTFRMSFLDSYIRDELVLADAEERGFSATPEEVSDTSAQQRGSLSDEDWQDLLDTNNITEEDYTEGLRKSITYSNIQTEVVKDVTATDDEVVAYAKDHAEELSGRRSSHILFNEDDKAAALDCLEGLQNGDDFAESAQKLSVDTGSGANGGDVGWDNASTFVTEYQDALNLLSVGEMSGLVESQFGWHIIKCTEEFHPLELGDALSIDDIPDDVITTIKSTLTSEASSEEFNNYVDDLYNQATIVFSNNYEDVQKIGESTVESSTE